MVFSCATDIPSKIIFVEVQSGTRWVKNQMGKAQAPGSWIQYCLIVCRWFAARQIRQLWLLISEHQYGYSKQSTKQCWHRSVISAVFGEFFANEELYICVPRNKWARSCSLSPKTSCRIFYCICPSPYEWVWYTMIMKNINKMVFTCFLPAFCFVEREKNNIRRIQTGK
jgi:hypothetical protein